ncbi:cytochrome P450 [Nocardia sp. NPDC004722]
MTVVNALPPMVSGGLPLVGVGPEFMRNPERVFQRGLDEHGETFRMRVFGNETVVLLGAENSWLFFHSKNFSTQGATPFFEKMFSPGFYSLASESEYRRQQRVLVPLFQRAQISGFIPTIEAVTDGFLESLGEHGEFDLTAEFGPLVFRIASTCFLGEQVAQEMGADFYREFRHFSDGMTFVPRWVKTPRNVRSQRAAVRLKTALGAMIERRRTHPLAEPDFLQRLVTQRYEDGTPVRDDILVDMVLLLAWAGYETTAGQLAWTLTDLLLEAATLARAREEADRIVRDGRLDRAALDRMTVLTACMKESENQHSIAPMVARRVTADTEVGEYLIPEGAMVLAVPALTHRLTDGLTCPAGYHPDRFLGEAGKTNLNSLLGFGAGTHRCLGKPFAEAEMLVILCRVIAAFDMELTTGTPRPTAGATGTKWPAAPVRISYRRR